MSKFILKSSSRIRRLVVLSQAFLLLAGTLTPLLLTSQAEAAQILNRSLTITSALPSATSVTYTIGDGTNGFKFGTSHVVKGMKFEVCTAAVGLPCTHPTGFSWASSGGYTLTNWQDTTAFTKDTTNTNDCDGTNVATLCLSRSGASVSENTTSNHKIVITGVVNPDNTNCSSNPNCSFFVRMTSYDNATYTTGGGAGSQAVDTGTVASSTVQALTVNAAVAEVLNFCIGSTAVNDATTSPGAGCGAVSGTSINIGTLDTTTTNVSPVNSNGGDNKNGIAMLRTNAASGATVSYDAIQQSGTNHKGTLRISGASCNALDTDLTDQCIRAQGGTQGTFTAGQEKFGMTTDVNCGATTAGSYYTCVSTGASPSNHLVPDSNYLGGGTGGSPTYGTGNGFAWVDDGTVTQIASSSTVVADEALILRFAATPSITTPFGLYAAQADFIAVPTY